MYSYFGVSRDKASKYLHHAQNIVHAFEEFYNLALSWSQLWSIDQSVVSFYRPENAIDLCYCFLVMKVKLVIVCVNNNHLEMYFYMLEIQSFIRSHLIIRLTCIPMHLGAHCYYRQYFNFPHAWAISQFCSQGTTALFSNIY